MQLPNVSRLTWCGILCIVIILAAGSALADHVYWMNPSGGNWNVGSNWNTGTPPTATDIAHINYDGTFFVTLNTNATVQGLLIGGYSGTQTLLCNSWELTVNGSLTIDANGALDLQSSAVRTSGDFILTNNGQVSCDNSDIELKVDNKNTILITRTCEFARTLLNDTTGTLTLEGNAEAGADLTVTGTFTNRGAIDLTSSWPPTVTTAYLRSPNEPIENEPTGQISALLGASFNSASTRWIEAEIHNAGTITAVSTGLTMYDFDATHTNTGLLYAQGAGLTFNSGGGTSTFENTGAITTDAGFTFASGTDTCRFLSGVITNNGTMSFSGNDVYFTGPFTNSGGLHLTGLGGNINLSDTLINNGTIYMVNGNLVGAAPVINHDSLKLVNSDVDVDCINYGVVHATINGEFAGQFTSMPGSKVVSEATSANWCIMAFDHSWTNHGVIELIQTGFQSSYVSLLNLADTLTNASDGTISAVAGTGSPAGSRYVSGQLINNGSLTVTGVHLYVSQSNAIHENHGDLTITDGYVTMANQFVNSGAIAIDTTCQFLFAGTKATLSGGTISGKGRFDNDNDTIHVTGPVANSARMYLGEATLLVDDDLTNTGTIHLGGTDGSGSGALINQELLEIAGGSVLGFGVTNEGSLVATLTNTISGAFLNSLEDTLTVLGSALGSAHLTIANGFSNHGTILLTSEVVDDITTATLTVTSGTLTNSSTGSILSKHGSSTGGERYLTAEVNNQGLIKSSSLKLVVNKSGAAHSNSGIIEVGTSALEYTLPGGGSLSNSGEIALQNLATMTVDQGTFTNTVVGNITGTGSMNLYTTTPTFHGYIEPGESPGRINMQTNNFNMESDAQLNVEISGLTATDEHDQLYCTVNAGFNGVLDIDLIDGYIPVVGDSFKVCVYGARTGNFIGILGLSQNGVTFDTNFTATGLWLVTQSITNDPPLISGMPATREFPNDSSHWLGIYDYVTDDWTDDSAMTYGFTVSNDSLLYSLESSGFLILTAEPGFVGTVTLGVTVTDEHGASSSDTTIVTVTASNTAPVIAGLADSVTFRNDSTLMIDLWNTVSDTETEDSALTYSITSANDSLLADWDDATGQLTLSAAFEWSGVTSVFVVVTDPAALEDADTITVTVTPRPETPAVFTLPDSVEFDANDSLILDIFSLVTDDSHDTLLQYAYETTNDSLVGAWNASTGMLTLKSTDDWAGVGWLIVSITDPDSLLTVDSCEVHVYPSLAVGDDEIATLPDRYMLFQNYPNPFNPSTAIEFGLPRGSEVRLVVYNVLGEAVRTLTDRVWPAGVHRVEWDGCDRTGKAMASGVYFYRLEAGEYSATQKMILVK
jgi:hypothetical protein